MVSECEPDALELWLRRQRRAWWQPWRWPLVVVAALILLDPAMQLAAEVTAMKGVAVVPGLYSIRLSISSISFESGGLLIMASYVVVGSAAAALCLAVSCLPPELAVALPRRNTCSRVLKSVRGTAYAAIAAAVLLPEILRCIQGFACGTWSMQTIALTLMDMALVAFVTIELAIWLVLRVGLRTIVAIPWVLAGFFIVDVILLRLAAYALFSSSSFYIKGASWLHGVHWPDTLIDMLKVAVLVLLWLDTRRGTRHPIWER